MLGRLCRVFMFLCLALFPSTSWAQAVQLKKLLASDGAAGDVFGHSVSLSGDRVLVGAYLDTVPGGLQNGSAYVFERQGNGTWIQVAKLLASDGAFLDFFGFSVSLSGDRALVGVHLDDDMGLESGSAYMFERQENGTWTKVAKLLASDGAANDNFGFAVSLSGDRALVGTSGDDVGFNSGSAYVFQRQGSGAWTQVAKLIASDGAAKDFFGTSVSLSGHRALVGASGDDDLGPQSGSAYVFNIRPLDSPTTQISLSSGGSQLMDLEAGEQQQNETYFLLGSLSGASPGIVLGGGLTLPLNPDDYFFFTAANPNSALLPDSLGALNQFGYALASFQLPSGLSPSLAGLTLNHAFVILKDGGVSFASNALALEFVP